LDTWEDRIRRQYMHFNVIQKNCLKDYKTLELANMKCYMDFYYLRVLKNKKSSKIN
jgi:hypothetical protein